MLESLAYIFLLSMALGYIFTRLRLPALIGMLIAGMALGGHGMGLLDESLMAISLPVRQIALVVILMRAGLALNVGDLRQVGRSATMLCFVPACFEIVGFTLLGTLAFDIPLLDAAIMGAVVAAVSPAVVVPKMLDLMARGEGSKKGIPQMIMAGGSVDDVFVIVVFTALISLAQGGEVSLLSFAQVPISIVLGLFVGVASGSLLVAYFKRFHIRDSLKLLIMLSTSFLLMSAEGVLKSRWGVSMSALLAVMTIGATTLRQYPALAHRLSSKFSKLWVAAEIMLFVFVGASVDLDYAWAAGVWAVVLILGAMAFRMSGVYVSMVGSSLNIRERLFCMIAYSPKATVQAAIGSIPLALGLPCGEMVLTVAVLAILITAPLGAIGIDLTHKKLLTNEPH
ncbi:MAG: cation:proton antiporter [Rikenellaceae bacterium]